MELSDKLFQYSESFKLDKKSEEETKKRIADYLFVSYAARNSPPIKIMKKALLPNTSMHDSCIFFSNKKASPHIASFINGTMGRYLDYNDTYLSKEAIHPSDNIAPILAVAYSQNTKGMDTIKAIAFSYSMACAFADAFSIRALGWDHVVYISISAAAGISHLLGLNEEKFKNALSLSLINSISMRQTRIGKLSMWKAATTGYAGMGSVIANELASSGMTGPSPIFNGSMGFFNQVSKKYFEVKPDKTAVNYTMIKEYPVEYHAMSAVEAALSIKERLNENVKIKNIKIETFKEGYDIIANGKEKLRPQTKETADHSLQYIVAYTLLYGEPNPSSYSKKLLADKKILSLIDRTSVATNGRYDKMYPEFTPVRISVSTTNGTLSEEVTIQKGHKKNPMGWEDILKKGVACMGSKEKANEIIKASRSFDRLRVKELLEVVNNVDTE